MRVSQRNGASARLFFQGEGSHLRLSGAWIGLDENLANANVLLDILQRVLEGHARAHDRDADNLRGRNAREERSTPNLERGRGETAGVRRHERTSLAWRTPW